MSKKKRILDNVDLFKDKEVYTFAYIKEKVESERGMKCRDGALIRANFVRSYNKTLPKSFEIIFAPVDKNETTYIDSTLFKVVQRNNI